jgi:hypothetical protein
VRTALLGPLDLAYLRGLERGVSNRLADISGRRVKVDVRNVLFGMLFQSGVDNLELLLPLERSDKKIAWLHNRITENVTGDWAFVFMVVHEVFRAHRVSDRKMPDNVFVYFHFLIDILHAAHCSKNLVYLDELPQEDRLVGALPPELLVPLRPILSNLNEVTTAALIPSLALDRESLQRLEDILLSSAFRRYEESHFELELSSVPSERARLLVRKSALDLCRKNSSLLTARSLFVGLLPPVVKVFKPLFSALPQSVEDWALKLLDSWAQSNRKLVVYPLHDMIGPIVSMHQAFRLHKGRYERSL